MWFVNQIWIPVIFVSIQRLDNILNNTKHFWRKFFPYCILHLKEKCFLLSNLQMYKMVFTVSDFLASVSMVFQLDFGTVPTVWYFLFSILHCHGCDCRVVRFTTTFKQSVPITTKSCEFESCSRWGVFDTTLCNQVCQWFSSGTHTGYNIMW